MFPILYTYGNIHFYTYGFSLFVALVVIYLFARRKIPGSILSFDNLDDLMLIIIGSLWMGGGLVHLFFSTLSGNTDFQGLFNITTLQQFSVFPVAIATTLAITVWCRWKKKPLIGILDFLIPFLSLGYGLHRILGCLGAGCCHGHPTDLPWGITFPENPSTLGPPPGISVHPTQIYLGLTALLTWWLIRRYQDSLQSPGTQTAAGLTGLSGSYFVITFFRADLHTNPSQHSFLSAQIMSLIVFLGALTLLLVLLKKSPPPTQ